MSNTNIFEKLTREQFLKIAIAMANDNRMQIISQLASPGYLCSQDLLRSFNIKQPTMSQHLKILRDSELVSVDKDGKLKYFYINIDMLEKFIEYAKEEILDKAVLSNRENTELFPKEEKPKKTAEEEAAELLASIK